MTEQPWWMKSISSHPYYTTPTNNPDTYYGFGGQAFTPNKRELARSSQAVTVTPQGMLQREPSGSFDFGGDSFDFGGDSSGLGSQDFHSQFGMEQPTVDNWADFGKAISTPAKYAGMAALGLDPANAMFNDVTGVMVNDVRSNLSPEVQRAAQYGMLGYGLATNPVSAGIGLVAGQYGAYDPATGKNLSHYTASNIGLLAANPLLGLASIAYDKLTAPSWESKGVDDWTPEEFNDWYSAQYDPTDLTAPPNITNYYQDSDGGWGVDGYSDMEAEGGFYGTDDNYGLADSGPSDYGGGNDSGGDSSDGGGFGGGDTSGVDSGDGSADSEGTDSGNGGSGDSGDSGGSVICTMYRDGGDVSQSDWMMCQKYIKYESYETYKGYLMWATPLVEAAKKYPLLYLVMRPLWKLWVKEMVHRVRPARKGSIIGSLVLSVGGYISRKVFSGRVRNSKLAVN